MLESGTTQGIAMATSTGLEVIKKFEPAFLVTTSLMTKTQQLKQFDKDLPPSIGGKFYLNLPDTTPVGTVVVIYWHETDRAVAETYTVKPRIDGKIVVEQTQVGTTVKNYIDTAVTGEKLGEFDRPTTLTSIEVGDDFNKVSQSTTPFRRLNIIQTHSGKQDYYRVAVATPNSLSRIK